MASNQAKPKSSSRWGSLLSGAVAGLESRLDNIFAEEEERARQDRAAGRKTTQEAPSVVPASSSRTASSTRPNDRLQERLAKVVATQKLSSQPSSEVPSRSATPVLDSGSPRVSTSSRPSVDLQAPSAEPRQVILAEKELGSVTEPAESTLLTSGLPINPARLDEESQSPVSPVAEDLKADEDGVATIGSTPKEDGKHDASLPPPAGRAAEVAQAPAHDVQADAERQEEMNTYLERIDALQAKLQYLARETVAAAKEANGTAQPGSLEQKVAEKDERIALLMDEGGKLSKTEMRHLATIRKLRAKTADEEKTMSDLQKKLTRLEQSETELKLNLKQAEQAERQANDRIKRLQRLEKDLESTKSDLDGSKATVTALRRQLVEAEKRADDHERSARETMSQIDSKATADLQEQLSDLKIEKKLAEDRFAAELKRITEASGKQKETSDAREAELSGEISNLESRIEALRSRAEEATSNVTGDGQAKLLRQIETLQTQYSLAAENWRTIESSLNSRIAAIEKERDEAAKREADVRKKARDVSTKSRRAEEELDRVSEEYQDLSRKFEARSTEIKALEQRCSVAEKALEDARTDFDRQRRVLESDYAQKLEEEKNRQLRQGLGIETELSGTTTSRTQSPTSNFRRASAHDPMNSVNPRRNLQRISSHDQSVQSASRRPTALGTPALSGPRTSVVPDMPSPGVSRQNSAFSLSQLNGLVAGMPPTPSIHTTDVDNDEGFDFHSSPQQTINDVISASTVHTGPSVQLVERMSSSIRRLESEKAAHRDELARITSQRDESRNEVVTLMREVEAKRQADDRAAKMEKELAEIKQRHEACLQILGEREEEVDELKGDVVELKRIYRDLAERSMK